MITTAVTVDDVADRAMLNRLADNVVATPRAPRMDVVAPFSGDVFAEVPVSTVDDVGTAVQAARDAAAGWAARPVTDRARIIGRVHDLVLNRRSELADMVQLEAGKARRDAFEEIADVALAARYVAARGPRVLRERRRLGLIPGLTRAAETYHPKGVVGVISPWNYPLTLAISDCLPAFVAGNAVVHKPDSRSVLTALLARSIAIEAGLPEGLWQIVAGDGPTVGGAIVDRVDYVSFTGSTATGRQVATRLGERLVGASLELGGKNPMLVLDDADADRAAESAVRACFSNAGQLCVSVERLYVDARVREQFLDRFLTRINALQPGAAFDYSRDMGTLVSQAQLDKVTNHVADATAKGARLLSGGSHRPDLGPWFFEPTVFDGVRPGMLAADHETFGPVVAVRTVSSEDEAVELANDNAYGLNASVWTGDLCRGVNVARRLRTGIVNVNEGYAAAWGSHDLPAGGMGASGLGRRHGREGILRYTDTQSIAVQRLHGITPAGSMGFETFADVMTRSLRAMRRVGRP